jgi:hypothetical protein
MTRSYAVLAGALAIMLASTGAASSAAIPSAAAAAERSGRDSKIAEVPFTVERNKVIVPVSAGGEVLRLILDTGHASDGILIFGSDRADTAAFGPAASAVIQGAGAGGGSAARLFEAASFDVGGVAFRGQRAIVLGGETFKGSPTDGTIGHSLLGHYAVELDYDRGVMTLHDSARFEPRPGWEAIPLSFKDNRIPWIDIAVSAADEPPVRLAVYIDCASSEAVELLTREVDKFRTPAVTRERYLGRGLSGDIYGREGTMAKVRLGSHELTNVLVAIVPAAVRSKQAGADAVVANGLLRRFNVIYDYARQKLYIKPNSHFTGPVR